MSCNCQCLNDVATRVTSELKTVVDHAYTNNVRIANTAGVVVSDLSHHYGICIIEFWESSP